MADAPEHAEETIFYQALEKAPAERGAFVKEACGADHELYRRVVTLLQAYESDDQAHHISADDSQVILDSPANMEQPGTVIGRYKLLEKIGEGGMAVVYMAEQKQPLRRKVALKIIKLGMDTQNVIARFEAERQALALMDHPNIARVFDAGATDTGRPYFVMELVHGVSITDFCNQQKLPMEERLQLFLEVCSAVQHAHQRGIIHRDLKPTNIMVTMHDDRAVPKVIDFGIAKATNQQLTEKTLFTRYAHMVGTPAYMSPEQAQMSGLGIDTRSDVYSLGVLLYELLTGTVPFPDKELLEAGYAEMQRIISEEEPIRPSTKLSTLGNTLTEVAKQRCCSPDVLHRTIRGDLDWIVIKSLEKNRARRYSSAGELVADIERHLKNEPVLAGPPSVLYKTGKFMRRNRAFVVGMIAVIVAVCAGLIGMAVFAQEANQARHQAVATLDYLEKYVFGALDPWQTSGEEVNLNDLIHKASQDLDQHFANQPLVEALLRKTFGVFYSKLGQVRKAEPELQRALELYQQEQGVAAATTLAVRNEQGRLYQQWHRHYEAMVILKQVVEKATQTLGPDDPLTLAASVNLGAVYGQNCLLQEALALLTETLERAQRVLGPEHEITLQCLYALCERPNSMVFGKRCRLNGLKVGKRVDGPTHPRSLHYSAACAYDDVLEGRPQLAQAEIEPLLETVQEILGPAHRETVYCMVILAWALDGQERLEEAETLLRQAVDIRRGQAPIQPDWLDPWCELAEWLRRHQRLPEAESLLQEALALNQGWWGAEHYATVRPTYYLGLIHRLQGRYPEAETRLREAFERSRILKGPWITLSRFAQLFQLYYLQDNFKDITALHEEYIAWYRGNSLGWPGLGAHLHNWAEILATCPNPAWRNGPHARELIMETVDVTKPETPNYFGNCNLAAVHAELGDFDLAVSFQEKAIAAVEAKERFSPYFYAVRPSMDSVLQGYQDGRPLRQYRLEGLGLGMVGRYPQEAEPVLLKAWESCQEHLGSNHYETLNCLWDVVNLYHAWDKTPEFQTWLHTLRSALPGTPAPPAGQVNFNRGSGTYTLQGAGNNLSEFADICFFAYQQLRGDGSITARIDQLEADNYITGGAALMIRSSLSPYAPSIYIDVTRRTPPQCRWRSKAYQKLSFIPSPIESELTVPLWLRLTRQGNLFRAEYSTDGQNWQSMPVPGPTVEIPMNETVYIGLTASSYNWENLGEARFSHVTVTGDVTPGGPFTEGVDISLHTWDGDMKDEAGKTKDEPASP